MTEFFKPLDFSQIEGSPHDILNDAIKKLLIFEGNNAIIAKYHIQKFDKHLVSYCNDAASNHEDVKMNLFALSLEDDAMEWYSDLGDDSYKTLNEFLEGFKKKWGEKKEPRHLLAALHNIKKMENETILNLILSSGMWLQTSLEKSSQGMPPSSYLTSKLSLVI